MNALDYPVALRLEGRPVLLVGAGPIALGRLKQLLEVGASVHVVAPVASDEIHELDRLGRIRFDQRPYAFGDCAGVRFVFTATNDRGVTEAVVKEARSRGILVNAADVPELCDFTIPSIGRRGPVAVSTSGHAPGLARHLRQRVMESVGPELGTLAKLMGRLRKLETAGAARTAKLKALAESRASELIAKRDWRGVGEVVRGIWGPLPLPPSFASRKRGLGGRVTLVGAGPGDPRLLTRRAAEVVREADVILHDRLVHPDVLSHARRHARLIYVGKEGGGEQVAQEEINRQLILHARLERRVVRLKGGDPFVFGRGGEEALALARAGIPFEVVPGVSSGIAAPAAAGIPVTHRQLATAVTFATASLTQAEPDWAHLAKAPTLVLFMVGKNLRRATEALVTAGRSTEIPAAVIESGTREEQRVVTGTLGDIAQLATPGWCGGPTLLVVGEVVALREELASVAGALAKELAS